MNDITIHISAGSDGYTAKVTGHPDDLHGGTLSALWLAVGREINRQKLRHDALVELTRLGEEMGDYEPPATGKIQSAKSGD